MHAQKIRRIIGFVILLLSLAVLLWGIWPASQARRSVRVHLPNISSPRSSDHGLSEDRQLILTWPVRLRVGDRGLIQLSIEEIGASAAVEGSGSGLQSRNQANSESDDTTEINNILAEGRLELSGMNVVPSGEIYETMGEDGRAVFFWKARADRAGIFDGLIWLHLNSVIPGDALAGAPSIQSRSLLSAQRIQMVADDLLGLNGTTARLLGSIGIVVACLLLFDTLFLKVLNMIDKENHATHA